MLQAEEAVEVIGSESHFLGDDRNRFVRFIFQQITGYIETYVIDPLRERESVRVSDDDFVKSMSGEVHPCGKAVPVQMQVGIQFFVYDSLHQSLELFAAVILNGLDYRFYHPFKNYCFLLEIMALDDKINGSKQINNRKNNNDYCKYLICIFHIYKYER